MCDGFNVQVVYTDLPNDRFEEWCSRKNKARSLHQPATQRRRHDSAGCSQGSFLHQFTALGIPADVPALKFALQVWKAFVIRPFPKIGATRSTHLRWQVQPPLCQCIP